MEELLTRVEEYRIAFDQYKVPIILILMCLICFIIAGYLWVQSAMPTSSIQILTGDSSQSGQLKKMIMVDVGGGVNSPGVYEIAEGSRIVDAIQAAGGLSEEASQEMVEKAINQAARVLDGAKLYIPIKQTSHNEDILGIDNTSHNNETVEQGSNFISINTATQAQIEALPGVGPVTAIKIIDNRPYMNIEELIQKKAVGSKLFEQIRPHITL